MRERDVPYCTALIISQKAYQIFVFHCGSDLDPDLFLSLLKQGCNPFKTKISHYQILALSNLDSTLRFVGKVRSFKCITLVSTCCASMRSKASTVTCHINDLSTLKLFADFCNMAFRRTSPFTSLSVSKHQRCKFYLSLHMNDCKDYFP
uniref:Ovule protein n=1 Tax=Ascaris lumbricoides TaxID=6252 RepID=A0A0M3IEG3_ASCLU